MAGRIGSLILKDTIQFARDKTILAVVFWMYTIEVLICGYGMTFEVRDLPIAVVDNDRSPLSRDLIDRFELSEAFEIVGYPADPATAERWMRRGKAQYGLVVPVNFGRDWENGQSPQLQVLLDGTNSNAASLAKDYTAEIVNRFQRERATEEPGGEIVLAGFYSQPLHFNFAPAFMREAQIRCAAEWQRPDLLAVRELAEAGRLSLDGLITHHEDATTAASAYRTAFGDLQCLKMVLDWRTLQ